jgi:hypothetical protein
MEHQGMGEIHLAQGATIPTTNHHQQNQVFNLHQHEIHDLVSQGQSTFYHMIQYGLTKEETYFLL